MPAPNIKNRRSPKRLVWVIAALVPVGIVALFLSPFISRVGDVSVDATLVAKLKSAKHFQSQVPAQRHTLALARNSSLRHAALNAIGMENREVTEMAKGDPLTVFAMLSHLGGFGEIIWVDAWTNFSVRLPPTMVPGEVVVPRRDAVRGALEAVEASGGCLIKAGKDRYLVAKVSEKEKYEAAIRSLGWLHGNPAPWENPLGSTNSGVKPDGPAKGSQPVDSGTNGTSTPPGSRR